MSRRTPPAVDVVTLVLLSALLGACAVTSPPSPQTDEAWQRHQQSLARLAGWSLVARVVLSADDDAWSGRLWWQQRADGYRIRFSAPTGQGGMELDGSSHGVEMRLADGQVLRAADAEALMREQLGWYLPLGGLRYWVTGMPEPGPEFDMYLDASGRLARLDQSQWEVRYPAYRRVGDLQLPRKVFMESDELSLRLVVDRWEPLLQYRSGDGA